MIGAPPLAGGCNCGDIRYRITRPILAAYICHCHRCQKRSGSAFSMSVVIPADGFDLLQGSPSRMERRLDGGALNIAQVCPACHSRILTQREGRPTISVRAGTLDETRWIRPVAQFWTSSAQPWALVRDDILSYAEQPTDFGPMLAAWRGAAAR